MRRPEAEREVPGMGGVFPHGTQDNVLDCSESIYSEEGEAKGGKGTDIRCLGGGICTRGIGHWRHRNRDISRC